MATSRRYLIKNTLLLASYAQFIGLASCAKAINENHSKDISFFFGQLGETNQALRSRQITSLEWKKKVAAILTGVDLTSLQHYIKIEKIISYYVSEEKGLVSWYVLDGAVHFGNDYDVAIGVIPPGGSIPLHGHNARTTVMMGMKGQGEVHQYDRIQDLFEKNEMLIRLRAKSEISSGKFTITTEEVGNVHCFKNNSNTPLYLFNTNVKNLRVLDKNPALFANKRTFLEETSLSQVDINTFKAKVIEEPNSSVYKEWI